MPRNDPLISLSTNKLNWQRFNRMQLISTKEANHIHIASPLGMACSPPTSSYNMCHYVSQMWDHLWGDREDHSMSTQIGYFAMNLRSQPINWWYTEGCNMRLMIVFWSSRRPPRDILSNIGDRSTATSSLGRSIFVDNIGNKPVHMSSLLLQALEL